MSPLFFPCSATKGCEFQRAVCPCFLFCHHVFPFRLGNLKASSPLFVRNSATSLTLPETEFPLRSLFFVTGSTASLLSLLQTVLMIFWADAVRPTHAKYALPFLSVGSISISPILVDSSPQAFFPHCPMELIFGRRLKLFPCPKYLLRGFPPS